MSIPEHRRAAVARALKAAFGVETPDSVTVLTGGLSGSSVQRIRVGGIAYVLRLEGPGDMFRDPFRWYGCLRIAAEGALAPRVHYADPADGVAILDFIETRDLGLGFPGGREAMLTDLAQTVRALHQGPAFPPLVDYLDAMTGLAGQLEAAGAVPAARLGPALAALAQAVRLYRTLPADLVPSHNDLNPRNLLFDGRRFWLVDFESAFQADRYVDLAALANMFARGEAEVALLARAYFGRAPTEAELARLWLMRQINHVFYGVMFLGGAGAAGAVAEVPSLDELHARLGAGEDLFLTAEGRAAYGLAHLEAARAGVAGPRFAAAAEILADPVG